jgi:hypothetical protein
MEILHLEEIPKHHIVKQWTRDSRYILPEHLVQYQKDNSLNLSFTCRHATLYLKAMEVVRMGDASAACYDHMHAGLEALLHSGAPLAEKRDGLAFEDRLIENADARLPANGEIAFVERDADQCHSAGHSFSVNALQGLAAPDKHRGAGRPTNSREKAPYEGLSKRTRFCSIGRREGQQMDPVPRKRRCAEKATETWQMQELRDRRASTEYLQKATWFRRELSYVVFSL